MQEQRLFVSNNPLPNKDTNIQTNKQELFSAYTPNFQKSHFTLSRKKAFEGVQTPSPPIKSIRSNY